MTGKIFAAVIALTSSVAFGQPGATSQPGGSAGAALTLVQAIKNGTDGVEIKNHVGAVTARGDFVYASIVYEGKIKIFKRDAATGKLTFVEDFLWGGEHDVIGQLAWANGMLYFFGGAGHWTGDGDSRGLHWCQADPKTGKLADKGKIAIPLGAGLAVSPDQKNLYLLLGKKHTVVRYQLDKAGQPVKADEAVFKEADSDVASLLMSSDGKSLYAEWGQKDYSLGCVAVKDDGSMDYKGATSLAKLTEGVDWPKGKWGYAWGRGLGISADGLFIYADFYNYGDKAGRTALYARDPKTGEVAFKARMDDKSGSAMVCIKAYAFEPNGAVGYFASGGESSGTTVGWFTRDPKTGLILDVQQVKTAGGGPDSLFLDSEHGYLYAGTWGSQTLYVLKIAAGGRL